MNTLKKIFPLAFKSEFTATTKAFIIAIIIHAAAMLVVSGIAGLLGFLLLFTWPIELVLVVANMYVLANLVFMILVFAKVFKVEATEEAVEAEAVEEAPVAEEAVAESADAE